MQKIDYYAVSRSMYGLLRNKRISYKGHLLVEARRKARHQVSNLVLHRKALETSMDTGTGAAAVSVNLDDFF